MKQATLKAAGTAALGVALAAVAAGSASAAAAGGPLGGLGSPGGLTSGASGLTNTTTGALNKTPAVGGAVSQTTGTLNPNAGAPAGQANRAATRGMPAVGTPLSAVTKAAQSDQVTGLVKGALPLGGGLGG
ncbi:hypothetical protein ACIGXM_00375 [Kitasatospora sp. NPDC052896]|uniref:hypothetical protein n=1 Tax=Kitasatospora sp. NPDC052896 TaxID=3364061 RepID=UPI0037C6BFB2